MKTIRLLLFAAAAIFLLQGCKGKGASIENVPATADYVAVINADSIPDALGALIPGRSAEQTRLAGCCDLSRILFYKPADSRQPFGAATVTDEGKLTSLLADLGWQKRKTTEGISSFSPEEGGEFAPCVIIEKGVAWFLGTRGDIKNWQESLRQAEKDNFGKYKLDFPREKQPALEAYVRPAFFGIADDGAMVRVTATCADNALTVKAGIISVAEGSTGEPIAFTALSPIGNTDFCRYLPSGPDCFALAAGLTDRINWTGLVEMLGGGLGTQNQGMLQTLLPYMASLNGPFALGVGPFSPESLTSDDIESQSILVYATLQGNKASEAVDEINGNLREKGLNPRPRPDGIYAFDLNGVRYRYTATGEGVFLFALNRELESPQPADSTLFAGRQALAQLSLPPLSAIVPGSRDNLSIRATVTVDSEGLTLVMRSGDTSPLTAFATYFNALEEAMRSREEQSSDYYDEL